MRYIRGVCTNVILLLLLYRRFVAIRGYCHIVGLPHIVRNGGRAGANRNNSGVLLQESVRVFGAVTSNFISLLFHCTLYFGHLYHSQASPWKFRTVFGICDSVSISRSVFRNLEQYGPGGPKQICANYCIGTVRRKLDWIRRGATKTWETKETRKLRFNYIDR